MVGLKTCKLLPTRIHSVYVLQGVMSCPECKNKLQVRISADDVSFMKSLIHESASYFIMLKLQPPLMSSIRLHEFSKLLTCRLTFFPCSQR